jgi:hypothetical protein
MTWNLTLKFVGIWPADDGVKFWKHFLFCALFFIGLASQALIICCEVTDVINTNELEDEIDSIFSVIITFQGQFKQLYASHNIRGFQLLYSTKQLNPSRVKRKPSLNLLASIPIL